MLKVSSTSEPSATAGALANTIREEGQAELQAIGPKAVNQTVKAITIARGYMAPSGVDLVFVPSFVDVEIDDGTKTAMRMHVTTRLPYTPSQPKRTKSKKTKNNKEEKSKKNKVSENNQTEQDFNNNNNSGGDDILDV